MSYGDENMKVSEFIKELRTVDQDLLVVVRGRDYFDMGWFDKVEDVEVGHSENVAVDDKIVGADVVIIG